MLTVAYLGPEQTNTHVAAVARFGRSARYLHAPTVDDVFSMVERRQAEYGVVPVENSLEGTVTHTLDRFIEFLDTPVRIQGEVERHVQHSLITHPKARLKDIRAVYSHPQALAQCRRWLNQHLPYAVRRETHSTADALQHLLHAANNKTQAAVARAELAKTYRLAAQPIPDQPDNTTRFVILGLGQPSPGRRNKTSMVLGLKDKPGALHDVLVPFKRNKINMTKIESRPSKRKAWEYLFFIDVDGHAAEPRLKRALAALARSTSLLRILGSYPTAR